NSWNGTWSAPGWETHCIGSDASLSPLWVSLSAPYYPNFNTGSFNPYSAGVSIIDAKKAVDYFCSSPGYPAVPSQRTAFADPTSLAENKKGIEQFQVDLFPNPNNGHVNILSKNESELL